MPRTRWACFLGLASLVACSSSSDDEHARGATSGAGAGAATGAGGSGAGGSVGTYDPHAGVPPYDPTGVVDFALALGGRAPVYEATGNEIAGMVGRGLGIDTLDARDTPVRQVFATFSQHDDVPEALQDFGRLRSSDAGTTFAGYEKGVDLPPQFALQLRDGRVLSYGFKPSARVDSDAGSQLTLEGQSSADDGATWTAFQATVAMPKMAGGTGSVGRLSGHPIELADGSILLPWYGAFAGDVGSYRAELLASSDGGQTFARRGSIAVPPADVAYPEADVVELQDGSLFSVFRHHQGSALADLRFATSSDGGVTWSAPGNLNIGFDDDSGPRHGIAPQLVLLPNGVLALSSGRPDNFLAVSTIGASMPGQVAFEQALVTYVNYPSSTTASYGSAVLRVHGSSGNTGLVVVDANRLAQLGDNCANGWGCPPADSGYHIDGKNRVWRRFVEAVTPDVGKIDLRGKVESGAIDVESNMTWTSGTHRRAGVEGAFDGSNDYWSSAVAAEAEGTLTLRLDREYDLTRVGLSIRRDFAGSASVSLSGDGKAWTDAPIVDAQGRTHRAMEYFVLPEPLLARWVKVVVSTSAPCDADVGAGCAFLNELELYSTIDSFENDPVGSPPRGYQDVVSAWVTDYQTGAMGRALRLVDDSDSSMATARWVGAPRAARLFELAVLPVELPGGFLFGIEGVDELGASVATYHFAVFPDGSVNRYDALAEAWAPLTGAGVVPIGSVTRLRVEATVEEATLFADGEAIATVHPSAAGATLLRGHVLSSSGTAPVGDQLLIDDVYFQ
jgi:hypothetical protein